MRLILAVVVLGGPVLGCLIAGCAGIDDAGTGDDCGNGICSIDEDSVGCPVDCEPEPVCGDGICDASETASACAADCTECTWVDATTCSGEQICLDGECVNAFGRLYTIAVMNGNVPQWQPSGDTWDTSGGAPDPFAVVYLNNEVVGRTSIIDNNFTPTWNESVATVVIPAGSTLEVDVFDHDDISTNEGILACVLDPLDADVLHQMEVDCAGVAGEVVFEFFTE